ncbi:hypothetical protein K9U39_00985 [Rhodoblastus acidophilus]|uniref:Uncharacterized protein n=1 Tax=Candidatus Rhodoblastus alkanivorans TaxID=2954117 RepID=A0ABS9Z3N1_9HYPH|nr:hypothetical protein [Candidatus Rhodoblastus alkanivorans]MCI4678844.1 hypothetical protein [Candidatus Rhodoblastus alkanivorans]MCI4682233.1 hypothetical protein [Candidatus Rhodoblastus alkanivorans]MDI4639535.1 hypothetical protein [Rhodoblastus acidophilus]
MSHEILKAMGALREDMRQRLMQAPEYRALLALDRSIEEIGLIMRDIPPALPEVAAEVAPAPEQVIEAPQAAQVARPNAIASAFAETLAAKMDQRHGARAGAAYAPLARAAGG